MQWDQWRRNLKDTSRLQNVDKVLDINYHLVDQDELDLFEEQNISYIQCLNEFYSLIRENMQSGLMRPTMIPKLLMKTCTRTTLTP